MEGAKDKEYFARKTEAHTKAFFESDIAKVVEKRISAIGYEGAGVSNVLNYLIDSEETMNSTLRMLERRGATFSADEVAEIRTYAIGSEELYAKWQKAPGVNSPPDCNHCKNFSKKDILADVLLTLFYIFPILVELRITCVQIVLSVKINKVY